MYTQYLSENAKYTKIYFFQFPWNEFKIPLRDQTGELLVLLQGIPGWGGQKWESLFAMLCTVWWSVEGEWRPGSVGCDCSACVTCGWINMLAAIQGWICRWSYTSAKVYVWIMMDNLAESTCKVQLRLMGDVIRFAGICICAFTALDEEKNLLPSDGEGQWVGLPEGRCGWMVEYTLKLDVDRLALGSNFIDLIL